MTQKVFLVQIHDPRTDQEHIKYQFEELHNLVTTYGWLVVVQTYQKRTRPDYQTYVWSGKLQEIKIQMQECGADLLIIGNILKPAQIYKINGQLRSSQIHAWDRVDLILKIFAKHATSTESRLQIELASIKHMWPRIFGMGMELSRQGWGSKLARWVWETNTEIMKRHLADKEHDIRHQLKIYQNTRSLHRESRIKKWLMTVGIVWYTNAGKSSLMNALCHKGVLAEDKLFATLGTSVGRVDVQVSETQYQTMLVNDTIGFIADLPPNLIEAFQSTLEDSIQSQILLHVIDAHDGHIVEKMQVVDQILSDIGTHQPRIYVFNKIDLLTSEQINLLQSQYTQYHPLFVSSHHKIGLEQLKKHILSFDF